MKKFLSIIAILVLIITQTACSERGAAGGATYSYAEDWLLNTFCYIKSFEPGQEDILKEAFKLAREYESKLSRTVADSQIVTGEYDAETEALLKTALDFEELSGGAFCVHLGAVSALWDFGGTSGGPFVPGADEIKEALSAQSLDLGAIAKGYIADRVADFLRSRSVNTAVISLGGNVVCLGRKASGDDWAIGIEKPFSGGGRLEERESAGVLSVGPDSSVVTSGIYERCFTADDGSFYHHILDPESGFPCESDIVSASIAGESSCVCDALATAAVVLGSDGAAELIESYNERCGADYGYVFIKADGGSIVSPGLFYEPEI